VCPFCHRHSAFFDADHYGIEFREIVRIWLRRFQLEETYKTKLIPWTPKLISSWQSWHANLATLRWMCHDCNAKRSPWREDQTEEERALNTEFFAYTKRMTVEEKRKSMRTISADRVKKEYKKRLLEQAFRRFQEVLAVDRSNEAEAIAEGLTD
jgi:hypothetical protein